jgi:hypothetical protein
MLLLPRTDSPPFRLLRSSTHGCTVQSPRAEDLITPGIAPTGGSAEGGRTAAALYSVVGTCKHLRIDPFAYLREALPGLFALGDEPRADQVTGWLPDRWLLRRARD